MHTTRVTVTRGGFPSHRHFAVTFSPFRCFKCGRITKRQRVIACCWEPLGCWIIQPAWREGLGTRYGDSLPGHYYRTKKQATEAKRLL